MLRYVCLIAFVALVSGADLEARAKLLASKTILNNFIVQNKDVSVVYKIFNVGSSAAYNVALNDTSFPNTEFKVVKGKSSVQWSSIPPNGNVTHVLVLQPFKAGYFNFTAAQLSYDITDGGEKQAAFTSAPGEGGIMTEIDFNRKHSPHLLEWAIFAVMCTPSILIPFLLWFRSSSKYCEHKAKKA
ncbi:translocon-associated protein subunit beta-like [Rhopilema esculentum]|uniref:translocon-associated protein subunit beta-like n=1 Tax=Rhopilema esculentum TaxID=499914 RepID=UPI0031DDDAB3|eukprot:gene6432-11875_t